MITGYNSIVEIKRRGLSVYAASPAQGSHGIPGDRAVVNDLLSGGKVCPAALPSACGGSRVLRDRAVDKGMRPTGFSIVDSAAVAADRLVSRDCSCLLYTSRCV